MTQQEEQAALERFRAAIKRVDEMGRPAPILPDFIKWQDLEEITTRFELVASLALRAMGDGIVTMPTEAGVYDHTAKAAEIKTSYEIAIHRLPTAGFGDDGEELVQRDAAARIANEADRRIKRLEAHLEASATMPHLGGGTMQFECLTCGGVYNTEAPARRCCGGAK